MRKVREVLRLKHAHGMSYRKISEATGVGKTQASECASGGGGRGNLAGARRGRSMSSSGEGVRFRPKHGCEMRR